MKFSNANASVLGLSGGESARDVDFARLAVGTLALDDVFHGFVAGVIFTVACEKFRERYFEFLHVIADIS